MSWRGSAISGSIFRVSRYCCFILVLLAPEPVFCWENLPEFYSLTEEEQATIEGPSALGPQYSSDLLAYGSDSEDEYRWLSRSRALYLGFGSLNTLRFMMENRLKVQVPVSSRFEFRFTYFNEADHEIEAMHHIIELIFWGTPQLGLVFYGEPAFRKPQDDTGLALLWRPSERAELRLFNTFVDVTRLKYPDRDDTFVEPRLPYSRGFTGRWWSVPEPVTGLGDFAELGIRYETPTSWRFSLAQYVYDYWRGYATFHLRKQFSRDRAGSLRFEFDRKYEARTSFADGALAAGLQPVTGSWNTRRVAVRLESCWYGRGPSGNWEPVAGIEYAARTWEPIGGVARYRDLLPYARLRLPAFGPPGKRDHWLIGYDLTWHRETGDEPVGIRPMDDGTLQHRFNVTYEFSLWDKDRSLGRLALLASADLDRFGTDKSWGGGAGKLELAF